MISTICWMLSDYWLGWVVFGWWWMVGRVPQRGYLRYPRVVGGGWWVVWLYVVGGWW